MVTYCSLLCRCSNQRIIPTPLSHPLWRVFHNRQLHHHHHHQHLLHQLQLQYDCDVLFVFTWASRTITANVKSMYLLAHSEVRLVQYFGSSTHLRCGHVLCLHHLESDNPQRFVFAPETVMKIVKFNSCPDWAKISFNKILPYNNDYMQN